MFGFKKKGKEVGVAYQYPVYKYTHGIVGEIFGFATFRPAAVDGFGVPVRESAAGYANKIGRE
jgi:hypothetical protein